jgi:hypothetical protein
MGCLYRRWGKERMEFVFEFLHAEVVLNKKFRLDLMDVVEFRSN